ncbi:RNA polymerase sigma factor [Patescibacteria group bacterium]
MQGLKEKYLLFKAKSFNDAEAYGEIYDRYVKRIYRFIFFKVNSTADAEDITSDVFLKTWQYIKEGKPVKNLNALLYSIARNTVVSYYRLQAKKREFEEPVTGDININENIIKAIQIKGDAEMLLQALKTLKDEYSEVIILRFLNDLSTAEVAKVIEKSQNNTRVLVHRALTALKKAVENK